jgi:hypothetical protein
MVVLREVRIFLNPYPRYLDREINVDQSSPRSPQFPKFLTPPKSPRSPSV